MESKYKILIPEPCNENWDGMTPNAQGKFCGSCQKNVVDFTSKSAVEIQTYFTENTGKLICGRFEKTQLNTITLQIPQQLLFSQVHFHKMFLLALLITMGTSLFSCSDSNGNKQKIDKVEIVNEESVDSKNTILGMLIPPPPVIDDKIDTIKIDKSTKTGEIKVIETNPKKPEKPPMLTGAVIMVPKDSINPSED